MAKRILSVLIFLQVAGTVVYGGDLPSTVLERQTQTALQQSQPLGLKHLKYMRYYMPTNQFRRKPAQQDAQYERALAMYLVNMYASTRVYGQTAPTVLTFNYVGVLDGFERCWKPFDFSRAGKFYQQHKTRVNALVQQHLQARGYPWEAPTQEDFTLWVQLLETLPRKENPAVFEFPAVNLMQAPLLPEVAARITPLLQHAPNSIRWQVVTYDEPDVRLEDLDSHIGIKQARRKRTYRWVREECYYTSYLLAKQLTQTIVQDQAAWEHAHLYLLTAYPKQGEFLRPAHGERFTLADGNRGLQWRYHTAVLMVLKQNGHYVTLVLDTFLGGSKPLALGDWLARFNTQTQLRAVPFVRSQMTEDALQVPERAEGNSVWVQGKKYEPADVLR